MWFVSQCERVALFVSKGVTGRKVAEWALKEIPDMCHDIDVHNAWWDEDWFVQMEPWEDGGIVLWGDDGLVRFEPASEEEVERETFEIKGEIVC